MKKILSTPVARALANKNNIDITKVLGTGPNGRILKQDVLDFKPNTAIERTQPKAETITSSIQRTTVMEDKRVKPTGLRKGIAKALKNSWNSVAYVNLVNEIDATELWNFRTSIKDGILAETGVKVTFMPFITMAIIKAIKKYPIFNARFDEKTQELVYQKDINIGIAVDTPSGLMVPVIKNADQLSLVELSREISRLAAACKDGTIKPTEMRGSTFTITNYGSVDALYGVPVINHPNLAITGVGAIKDKVYFKNEEVVPGKVLYLTTAGDHQWVDGADIGRFAYDVRMSLENPAMLLALY
ncbi:2-oxo acid dehydrogenase subunit E2 [Mycoplasma todarodis]|uniref:Dihydrolipoamide acetyltransferase n=1 Tax=Mycoplasma todarodis TaxID=1937191 RepID=A0A4V2NI04_9MOLU|nr:2-oxo acid dehydrogenase subunit E2 [Mycoplasma todarodis]TCG10958.1 dihydrolipoamide acetyltransferase [Mycoplasma todarodis]